MVFWLQQYFDIHGDSAESYKTLFYVSKPEIYLGNIRKFSCLFKTNCLCIKKAKMFIHFTKTLINSENHNKQ